MSQTKSELLADSFGNFATGSVPIGGIIMWSGSIASIPTGWNLCNGQNNTPDLRNRFVLGAFSDGAPATYPNVPPGATGGSADAVVVTHTHTATSNVTDPGHNHVFPGDDRLTRANGRGGWTDRQTGTFSYDAESTNSGNGKIYRTSDQSTGITVLTSIISEGESGTGKNLPPYYALAYIMRVS